MKRSLPRSRLSKLSSFTLVELLVVIGIIAILAGVILSAGTNAIRAALRSKAQNLATQIQTASLSYYTEYGVYPDDTTTFPAGTDYVIKDTDAADWKNLLIALCGNIDPATGTAVPTPIIANSRGITFLTLKSSDVTNDAPLNPLPPNAANIYFNIAIDNDYDGILGVAPSAVLTMPQFSPTFKGTGGGTSTAGIAVWANCNPAGSTSTNAAYYIRTY
ncbi:MAG: type II secretion system GspH family protein [Methylacidiphilales bacterium]|nr:type II secretion system GspH family protein [Candidatus Methylacidiphilales bacterium]